MSFDTKLEILMATRKKAREACIASGTSGVTPSTDGREAATEVCAQPPVLRDAQKREGADTPRHEVTVPPGQSVHEIPRDHQELARAIFVRCDPVGVAQKLFASEDPRTAPLRARLLETLADWLYGKPAAASGEANSAVQMVWDLPAPSHGRLDPEQG
jgi:hypothetical protein